MKQNGLFAVLDARLREHDNVSIEVCMWAKRVTYRGG
jgi:hypothetical protein